jgi:hypothetical protein
MANNDLGGLFGDFAQGFGLTANISDRIRKRNAEQAELEEKRRQEEALTQRNQAIMQLIGQIQERQDPAKAGVEGLPEFANITGMDTESLQAIADLAGTIYPDVAPQKDNIERFQIGDKVIPHVKNAQGVWEPVKLASGEDVGGPKFAPTSRKTATDVAKKEADLKRSQLSGLTTAYKANMNAIFNRLRLQLAPEDVRAVENAFGTDDEELRGMIASAMVGAVQKAALPPEAKQALLNEIAKVNNIFIPLINDVMNIDVEEGERKKSLTQEAEKRTSPDVEVEEKKESDGNVVGNKFVTTDGRSFDVVNGVVFIDGQRYRIKE